MRTMQLVSTMVSAVALAALCAACGSDTKDAKPAVQPLSWTNCPAEMGTQVQCASVEVPLDWDKPDGDKITVGLNRLPASDAAHRIGSLVIDPGGPGGAGTGVVAGESAHPGILPAQLRSRFDLIGFDPRGIGTSKPLVQCDTELQAKLPDIYPTDQASFDALVAANRALGQSCQRLTGPLLDHVDTINVARDLDVVRQRLGDGPLNYLGLSYGTEIGFEYARLFPGNSRALVLDGALVHSLPPSAMHVYETAAFEDTLHRFADWCHTATDCALGGDDANSVVRDLATQARRAPLAAPGCAASGECKPTVGLGDLMQQIQDQMLFAPDLQPVSPGWPGLAKALDQARHGDATALSPAKPTPADAAGLAVGCAEFRADFDSYAMLKSEQALAATLAPNTLGIGQSYSYLAQCQGWPGAFSNPPHTDIAKPTIRPLLVNATHDPSTSYGWAQLMATEIPNAVFLTRDGNGHTSSFLPGQTRDAIVDYLINGTLPAPGTVLPN
ncbi:alpha/beta hydrolase [Nocardia sp. NPDC020380]|uniref:alpha/beta hydrolase n=1 Tax=Nocardia sp. NPDC020380 TaxID=3364309 RepID=UPI00378D1222